MVVVLLESGLVLDFSITVLICTYNRATRLALTLDYFADLDPPGSCDVELLVVDNNSTDATAETIARAAGRSRIPIRTVCESRQGKSFALNAGLSAARGDVLALTDDDVLPALDWLERISEAFRDPTVVFAGGRVLPRWEESPPAELLDIRARDLWGPLALVDYGDEPLVYGGEVRGQRPVGANLAIRRSAMLAIGGWRTDMGKVNNSLISGEDHEIFYRLLQANLYVGIWRPEIVVYHDVPAARVSRRYFHQWFFASGRARALMMDDLYGWRTLATAPTLLGVPRFMYRQFVSDLWEWALLGLQRDRVARLTQEMRTVRLAGTIWERWRLFARGVTRYDLTRDRGSTSIPVAGR